MEEGGIEEIEGGLVVVEPEDLEEVEGLGAVIAVGVKR